MAKLSITRKGDRVSVNLDCDDSIEADDTFYNLASQLLDQGRIEIERGDKPVFWSDLRLSDFQ